MSKASSTQIHPSLRDSFVPLPSDPSVPLTPEQIKAVFAHPEVWRDMIALTLQQQELATPVSGQAISSDGDAA